MKKYTEADIRKLLSEEPSSEEEKEIMEAIDSDPELAEIFEKLYPELSEENSRYWQKVVKTRPLSKEVIEEASNGPSIGHFRNFLDKPDGEFAEEEKRIHSLKPSFQEKLSRLSYSPASTSADEEVEEPVDAPPFLAEKILGKHYPIEFSYELDSEGKGIFKNLTTGDKVDKIYGSEKREFAGAYRSSSTEEITYPLPEDLGEISCSSHGKLMDITFSLKGKWTSLENSELLLQPEKGEVYSAPLSEGKATLKGISPNWYQVLIHTPESKPEGKIPLFRFSTDDFKNIEILSSISLHSAHLPTGEVSKGERALKVFALGKGREAQIEFIREKWKVHLIGAPEISVALRFHNVLCTPEVKPEKREKQRTWIFSSKDFREDDQLNVTYHEEKNLLILFITKGKEE